MSNSVANLTSYGTTERNPFRSVWLKLTEYWPRIRKGYHVYNYSLSILETALSTVVDYTNNKYELKENVNVLYKNITSSDRAIVIDPYKKYHNVL
jgi:hypothetical protein